MVVVVAWVPGFGQVTNGWAVVGGQPVNSTPRYAQLGWGTPKLMNCSLYIINIPTHHSVVFDKASSQKFLYTFKPYNMQSKVY